MAGGAAPVLRNNTAQLNSSSAAAINNDNNIATTPYSRTEQPNFMLTSHSEALLQGLNALRCSDKLFDVTLIVEGKRFKAHRVVLAACSDYFCAMFTDAMREARQSEIKLNGVNARGIELLIEYAYTSKLELDRKNIQDVLSVSTHVQMKAVIEACSNYLESQIDFENCVAIAALADLYALEFLKRKTYRYICARLDEFSQTSDLISLTWDQLEYILCSNYPVDCSEERVLQIALQYCCETKLKTELSRMLFAKVRFSQIDENALNSLLSNTEELDEDMQSYIDVVKAEVHKQKQVRKHSTENEEISLSVLTNSRGMELALVKIGGFETNGLTNQISCYLPSVGKWEDLTVIPHIEQCNYGTAVLGNDLYIVGGSYDVCLKEYIHPFGFRYCPTKDKWKTIAPIQADRCRFSLNAMGNNFLYAVGGVSELNDTDGEHYDGEHYPNEMPTSNCERYNASVDRWEYIPALSEHRSQHAGVVLDDKLYISGGIDRHTVLDTLWNFDANAEKWTKLSSMPTGRADHVLIAFGQHIYACGGWYETSLTETRILADAIDVYDVKTDTWSTETKNPMPKYYTGVAAVKRRIYFIGGLLSTNTINRATSAVQIYDLDTKQWSFNVEWEYPKEVWECTLAAFYVPGERADFVVTGGK